MGHTQILETREDRAEDRLSANLRHGLAPRFRECLHGSREFAPPQIEARCSPLDWRHGSALSRPLVGPNPPAHGWSRLAGSETTSTASEDAKTQRTTRPRARQGSGVEAGPWPTCSASRNQISPTYFGREVSSCRRLFLKCTSQARGLVVPSANNQILIVVRDVRLHDVVDARASANVLVPPEYTSASRK